jgi:hypothetical protein
MTTRRAAASRLALPILAASLLLTGCSDPWPENVQVESQMLRVCGGLGDVNDQVCHIGFTDGYFDAKAAIEADGDLSTEALNEGYRRQSSLVGSVAYTAGVEYARSVRP